MKYLIRIVSVLSIIAAIILAILSSTFKDNVSLETSFKVSIAFSLTISLTFNVYYIRNTVNINNYYNNDIKDLDEAWKKCFLIFVNCNKIISLANNSSISSIKDDKETQINTLLDSIVVLINESQALLSIYDFSKKITINDKNRLDFMNDYLQSLSLVDNLKPYRMISAPAVEKNNGKILNILKAMVFRYNEFKEKGC